MKLIAHNFWLKALSLVIAIVLWLLVTRGITNL